MFRRFPGRYLAAFAGAILILILLLIPMMTRSAAPTAVLHAQQATHPTQAELDVSFIDIWKQQTREKLNVPATGAKVVVVKFNDWMCPGCRAAAAALKPLLDKYADTPGALQYVEKDWPWNTKCNAAAPQTIPGHEASCDAAVSVRLAADLGKREAMATWLYASQPADTQAARAAMPGRVRAKAVEMLAVKDFDAAYALKLPDIRKDVTEGQALGIRGTPTYFINGIRAAGADGGTIPVHYFELALKYEFEKK